MAKKKAPVQEDRIEAIEETLSRTEQYIEENQKTLIIIIAVIVIIIGGYWSFKNFYLAPQEIEAQKEMYHAQYFFEKDSFNLALNGNGEYLGFVDLANDYSLTNAGNLSKYYAGICNLQLGDFESAIDYLSDFSSDDRLVSTIALGALGDAHLELEQYDKAIKSYKKAANNDKNELTAPHYLLKAGIASELSNNYDEALAFYTEIKDNFSSSQQARDIKKYIARVEAKK